MSRLAVLSVLAVSSCFAEKPWKLHTIDNTSQGADGVRLADVNGDGLLDIATGWEEGGVVRAYLHPGRGKEQAKWPIVTVGKVSSAEDAVFVDLDEDGAVDVVSSCEGGTRSLFAHWAPRNGKSYLDESQWKTQAFPAAEKKQHWMYALPMQLDGQHGKDLIVASKGKGGSVSLLQAPENPRDVSAWTLHRLEDAGWIMSLIASDMNGDGLSDVLISDRRGSKRGIYWLQNPGPEKVRAGAEWQRHNIGGGNREIMFISQGDLDQDGQLDVMAMDRRSCIWYRRTTEGWSEHVIPLPAGVGSGKSAAIADVDGDGKNDVVFSCEGATRPRSGIRWLSWEKSPSKGPWKDHEISGEPGVKYDRIELTDIDGDGDLDLLTCEERDGLGVFWHENPFGKKKQKRPPNVILIMADDVGTDAIGCYGGESYKTPHIDKLAADGMRFTHFYSMAVCHPTRVALMTGKYPSTLGNPRWGSFPKAEDAASIGSRMKQAGYQCAVAGKWQLSLMKNDKQQPARMGFDEWLLFGWHEGGRYHDPFLYHNGQHRKDTKGKFGPDLYTQFLIDFMERNRERPFFAYFPMALCHDVTDDTKEFVPFYKDGRWMTFGEMVKVMDDKIGELVAAVDRLGLTEDTLILFLTDNGSPRASYITVKNGRMVKVKVVSQQNGKAVPGGKGLLKDRGTRVPLIASWPGTIEGGQIVVDLVDMSDFVPTLSELGGKSVEAGSLDGVSFAARLTKGTPSTRRWAIAEHKGKRFARTQRWKLYRDDRLFDVANDPEEEKPLVDVQQEPEVQMLREALKVRP